MHTKRNAKRQGRNSAAVLCVLQAVPDAVFLRLSQVCLSLTWTLAHIIYHKTDLEVTKVFVKTLKVKNLGYILIGVLVLAVIVAAVVLTGKSQNAQSFAMANEQERLEFLHGLGWETSDTCTDSKVVVIPEVFDDVYKTYNKLQKEQGFDLERYKGKTAEIYTYEIRNYPDCPEGIIANLIVIDNKLVGGDVCSTDLQGFMQGLVMPESGSKRTESVDSNESLSENSTAGTDSSSESSTEGTDSTADTDSSSDTSSADKANSGSAIIISDTIG